MFFLFRDFPLPRLIARGYKWSGLKNHGLSHWANGWNGITSQANPSSIRTWFILNTSYMVVSHYQSIEWCRYTNGWLVVSTHLKNGAPCTGRKWGINHDGGFNKGAGKPILSQKNRPCYPLVNWRSYGKSPFSIDKSTVNGRFQYLCWITRR
jgi:hypothetical protein